MEKAELDLWKKLEARAGKLEKDLKSPKLNRPSQVYQVLSKAPGDQVLFLLMRSAQRIVQDRIRNYLQKYLAVAQEVTDDQVQAEGLEPGTPKFEKAKEELIVQRLNARPKKPAAEEAPEPPPEQPPQTGGKKALRQPIVRS
jgi:hypothetical protein